MPVKSASSDSTCTVAGAKIMNITGTKNSDRMVEEASPPTTAKAKG